MGTTVYWRPFVNREAYHYWTDDTAKVFVESACGRKVPRRKLEVYVGFARDQSKLCTYCVKERRKKS